MRPGAFRWIMKYERFLLLVCLIAVTCFVFRNSPWFRRSYLAKTGHLLLYLDSFHYQGGLSVLALLCGATGKITRFPLKRISPWMLSSSLKSKYLLISSLVSGKPFLILCFNCWRPSSSVFLLSSPRRSLVIGRNSTMLISPMIWSDNLHAWILTPRTSTLLFMAYWEGMLLSWLAHYSQAIPLELK